MSNIFKHPAIAYNQNPGTTKKGVLDFSWMNEVPAGKHGFVKTEGSQFVFEDGTPVKFFGVNLGFGAAFPEKEVAEAFAEELASNGVNFARLHATDLGGGIVKYENNTSQGIDYDQLDKMDYLIYCLKQKGIYIHLDLLAGKFVQEGDGFTKEECDYFRKVFGTRAIRFFDKRIRELDKLYLKAVLRHYNPYTGLLYVDEPAIAIVQYVNEAGIVWLSYPGENSGFDEAYDTPFDPILNKMFNEWLLKKYGSREALDAAWTNDRGEKALGADEDPAKGTVWEPRLGIWCEALTDWRNDVTKAKGPLRHADHMEFLMSVQSENFLNIYEYMRELGVKCPINCSNCVGSRVESYLNSLGDVIENNTYWNHPMGDYSPPSKFHLNSMTDIDPRVYNSNRFETHSVGFIAKAAVTDKPTVITEWNAATPTQFRADAILQMASYGALQGWAGFTGFNFCFHGSKEKYLNKNLAFESFFDIFVDPSMWGQFGIAAAIFRLGLVKEAKNHIECVVTKEDLRANNTDHWELPYVTSLISRYTNKFVDNKYFGDADLAISSGNTSSGDYSDAKRTLIQSASPYADALQHNNVRDAWLAENTEAGAKDETVAGIPLKVGKKSVVAYGPADTGILRKNALDKILTHTMREFGLISENEGWVGNKAVSDTGELVYDVDKKAFSAVTPSVAIWAGLINKEESFGPCRIVTENDKAAVAVFSKEGDISTASSLFVYAMGRCAKKGMYWEEDVLMSLGEPPVLYEDVRGDLFISTNKSSARAWALDHNGNRIAELPTKLVDGVVSVTTSGSCFFEIVLS